jgi:hypothetical protein
MPQPQIILPFMPCLQPYGEYGGQAANALTDANNKIDAKIFFMFCFPLGLFARSLAVATITTSVAVDCLTVTYILE